MSKRKNKKMLKKIITLIDEDYRNPNRSEVNIPGELCIVGDSYGYVRSIGVIRDYIRNNLKLPLNP